jgi:hypothetical protein
MMQDYSNHDNDYPRDGGMFAGGSLFAEQVDPGYENVGAGNQFLNSRRPASGGSAFKGFEEGINNMMEFDANNQHE